MNELPFYVTNKNKSVFRLDYINLKLSLLILFSISFVGIYLLYINLPNDAKKANKIVQDLFIPDVREQNPAPPMRVDKSHVAIQVQTNPPPPPPQAQPTTTAAIKPVIDQQKTHVLSNTERRETVRGMMKHAWSNYEKYAWGHNELRPITHSGHSAGIFGASSQLGATIVDALDTLYLMDFKDEYTKGRDWIDKSFNFNVNSDVSAFEINIRFIGGFLSLHSLTGDKMFLDKAVQVANALMPIFDTPTGLPLALINVQSKRAYNYGWASGGCTILSEAGTLILEFSYLSDMTGQPIYKEKVKRIQKVLNEAEKDKGLYYNYINQNTGKWCMNQASVGALGDSFYEYLLKTWIYSGKTDELSLKMYLDSMDAIQKHMLVRSEGGLTFIGEYKSGRVEHKMDHLACFIVGLFALTAQQVHTITDGQKQAYKELALNITHTCHESYARSATKIGPEAFHFERKETEAQALRQNERYYILRPEVIESYFYSWRLTKDDKYRDWAWEAVQALEKYCRTDAGYSGIKDVYDVSAQKDDVQQSFFLAETLKYLFLIFSDDTVVPLDQYVFNTEAHPLRINAKA